MKLTMFGLLKIVFVLLAVGALVWLVGGAVFGRATGEI